MKSWAIKTVYTGILEREECEIPDYCKPYLESYKKILEAVAETSDAFMERYFEGEEFSIEEIRSAMRTEVMNGDIVPVAMGSIFRHRVLQTCV